jgi:hypothetical protein
VVIEDGHPVLGSPVRAAKRAAREALHGTTVYKQVPPELNKQVTAKLIEIGLLRVGGTVAAITERELRAEPHANQLTAVVCGSFIMPSRPSLPPVRITHVEVYAGGGDEDGSSGPQHLEAVHNCAGRAVPVDHEGWHVLAAIRPRVWLGHDRSERAHLAHPHACYHATNR